MTLALTQLNTFNTNYITIQKFKPRLESLDSAANIRHILTIRRRPPCPSTNLQSALNHPQTSQTTRSIANKHANFRSSFLLGQTMVL